MLSLGTTLGRAMYLLLLLLTVPGYLGQFSYELKACDSYRNGEEKPPAEVQTQVQCLKLCSQNATCCGFGFSLSENNVECTHFTNCDQFGQDQGFRLPLYVKIGFTKTNVAEPLTTDTTKVTSVTSTTEPTTSMQLEKSTTNFAATTLQTTDSTTTKPMSLSIPETSSTTFPTTTELITTMAPPLYNCTADGLKPISVSVDELYNSAPCHNVQKHLPDQDSKFKKMPTPITEWFSNHTKTYNDTNVVNHVLDLDTLYEESSGKVQVLASSNNGVDDIGMWGWMLSWNQTALEWSIYRDRRMMQKNNYITTYGSFTCP